MATASSQRHPVASPHAMGKSRSVSTLDSSSVTNTHALSQCLTESSPPPQSNGFRHQHRAIETGETVDDFRLESILGYGGMGVVYQAWDLKAQRPAAVKVMGGAITDDELYLRFEREAMTVARLQHPGIVKLIQLGQTTSCCYMAMELIDGIPLRRLISELHLLEYDTLLTLPSNGASQQRASTIRTIRFEVGNMVDEVNTPPTLSKTRVTCPILQDTRYIEFVSQLLCDLSSALAHAHVHGVTHRDLKPENVMMRSDGSLVVIDFGLARSFVDATLTTQSAVIGTPMYMAPEQLQGTPAGPPSDVYAIGLIGYELLTRSLPFRATTIEGLLGEVPNRQIPPVHSRNASIPTPLANIVHRAMAKNPSDRYPSAVELRQDLERYLAKQTVLAPNYHYHFSPKHLLSERPLLVTLAGFGNIMLGGFLATLTIFAIPTNPSFSGRAFGFAFCLLMPGIMMLRGLAFAKLASTLASLMLSIPLISFAVAPKVGNSPLMAIIFAGLLYLAALLFNILPLVNRRSRAWLAQMVKERASFYEEMSPSQIQRRQSP